MFTFKNNSKTIGSVHPPESGAIACSGEKRERANWMKREMSSILLTCRIDIYSPFCPLSLS